MVAMVSVDVTDAWDRVKAKDLSFTAYVLACLGRAVAAHPEVHAYRDWLGRLVLHHHVDVATMVEVGTKTGAYPLAHPVCDTDTRTVAEIADELRMVQTTPTAGRSGRVLMRWGTAAGRIPGVASLLYFVARRSPFVRSGIGTVALSSVGMMIGGSGFATGVMTIFSLTVLVGGAAERAWVVDGEVGVRRILDVTVQIDHRVVDGGPAARFGVTLRRLLEDPESVDW